MPWTVQCPACGADLEIDVDLSDGLTDEVGVECTCGEVPLWRVLPDGSLGAFSRFSVWKGRHWEGPKCSAGSKR